MDRHNRFETASRSGSTKSLTLVIITFFAITVALIVFLAPRLWRALGGLLGSYLRHKTAARRKGLLRTMNAEEAQFQRLRQSDRRKQHEGDDDWEQVESISAPQLVNGGKGGKDFAGVIGFFHPFCNAGGGGERVLWAAIRASQKQWPNARIVVYTGDHKFSKGDILNRVKERFNIDLHPTTIQFLYLSTRSWVLASSWPRFTLAGQSLGSIVLLWDAFSLMVPDIFVDTMGYAFALGFAKYLFQDMPTGAYVHYPTISTDMLDSLDPKSAVGQQGVNAGKGKGWKGTAKKYYWRLFAWVYAAVGSSVDVVMTNSSWTQAHIQHIWGPKRSTKGKTHPLPAIVYPPCAVEELTENIEISETSEKKREKVLLYIAQFRPEKNHQLICQSFADFLDTTKDNKSVAEGARLVLVGSIRDNGDAMRVYKLRLLANELQIQDRVEFHTNVEWPDILGWLSRSYVGVNGMWNEHFGIGVVEYQAAGLISVVHDSGGPREDIVTVVDGGPTGFHATTAAEFAAAFEQALSLPDPVAMRRRARKSSERFTEEVFARKWIEEMSKLVAMT